MALDNASNNDKMLKELPHLLPASAAVGTDYQIRCFGHILNLCTKAYLSLFDTSKKARKADGDSDENENEDEDEDSADEVDEDVLEEDEEGERDTGDWEEIEELCGGLNEVVELEENDKVVGRQTMTKVCGCYFFFITNNIFILAPKTWEEVPQL